MDAATLNVRINNKLKSQAMKVADQLGLTLSAVVNGFLSEFVRSKSLSFSVSEEPSEYLIKALKRAEIEDKKGDYYSFENSKDALTFLDEIIAETK